MRAALTVVTLIMSVTGCRSRELSAPLPVSSAVPEKKALATLDAPARAVIEQALIALGPCRTAGDEIALLEWNDYDRCAPTEEGIAELERRTTALEGAAREVDASGIGATFVRKATLYRDHLRLVSRTKDSRGSALLYQELSRTWNGWKPDQPVPLDPPDLVRDHFGLTEKPTDTYTAYVKLSSGVQKKRYDDFVASGQALAWVNGPNGPYLASHPWWKSP